MRCVATAVEQRCERHLAPMHHELAASQFALRPSSEELQKSEERNSELVAEMQSIKNSVQLEVRQFFDGVTAEYAARERELLQRVQKLEFDLRARPLIEDGWTRDPAGDAGPGPLQAARCALEIATQECENL